MSKGKFSKHEIETTIRVLMESRSVKNWVDAEARFLGVNLNTLEGQEFYKREARQAAERLLK